MRGGKDLDNDLAIQGSAVVAEDDRPWARRAHHALEVGGGRLSMLVELKSHNTIG